MLRSIWRSEVEKKRNTKSGIRINNSKIKKERRGYRLTQRQIFLITVMLFVFTGSSISYVWSNFEGTQIGYDLSRLQKQELKLKELQRKLRVELATLRSPQYLEKAAGRLGLRQALIEQIIILQ